MPREVTSQIGQRAAQLAREDAQARGWRTADSMYAISGTGYAGVASKKKFHMYQEKGTAPFLMTALEGKTVPIKGADGGVHFVKVRGVGKPGYVTLPGGVKRWRDQKWRHPGVPATNIMGRATRQAIIEERQAIVELMRKLVGLDVTL